MCAGLSLPKDMPLNPTTKDPMRPTSLRSASLAFMALAAGIAAAPGSPISANDRLEVKASNAIAKSQTGYTKSQAPGDTRTDRLGGQWARTTRGGRRAGYGWTNRHAQRVARKAKNVRRHRAANR